MGLTSLPNSFKNVNKAGILDCLSILHVSNNKSILESLRTEIKFNQPIYVRVALLDISRTLMYDFYYKLKKR